MSENPFKTIVEGLFVALQPLMEILILLDEGIREAFNGLSKEEQERIIKFNRIMKRLEEK